MINLEDMEKVAKFKWQRKEELEAIKHKNVMEEIKAMKEANIRSFRR